MTLQEYYGFRDDSNQMYPIQSFATANPFVQMMNKGCYQMGCHLKAFGVLNSEEQVKAGVTDVIQFDSLVTDKSIFEDIVDYREQVYKDSGDFAGGQSATLSRALLFDYLLSISICYIEVPKYVTKNGQAVKTFDKFLATRNPEIMGTWMGESTAAMQLKYSSRISQRHSDLASGNLRAVKLTSSAKGNSIVCPRGTFPVDKMTCVPLFMQYAFLQGLKTVLTQSIVEFTYLKDNGTERKLATTLSKDILLDYYDSDTANKMYAATDVGSKQQGGMLLSSGQTRGYVRVPEVGISKYDATGVRALNLSRILSAKVVDEVDRTFINVDISSVVPNFEKSLEYLAAKSPDQLQPLAIKLGVFEGADTPIPTATASLLEEITAYVNKSNLLFSTKFQESLHLFMVSNSMWFDKYLGTPVATYHDSSDYGIATYEF